MEVDWGCAWGLVSIQKMCRDVIGLEILLKPGNPSLMILLMRLTRNKN